jgi:hypothetical protein
MSTASEREVALRRALLRAADQIEPAPGGLERIQVRLRRPRPALIAWAEAAWTALVMRAPDFMEAVRRRSASVLRLVWERFGPRSAPGGERHRLSWVRPLAAMTVAVFVLGGGVYVALQSVSSTISPTNGVAPGAPGGGGSHTAKRGHGGHGSTDGQASQSPSSSAPASLRPSRTGSRSASTYNPGSPSPAPPFDSPSPTGSLSPSTTPPTSSSPPTSPTPTSSGSTTPASGGSVSTAGTGSAS